jgi:AbrB family looped-hinge helix DNA binding protein
MTVVHMSEEGQIVVPKEIRDKMGLGNGSAFAVAETQSGRIVLTPVKKKPRMGFLDYLRGFEGIDVPEMKGNWRPQQ